MRALIFNRIIFTVIIAFAFGGAMAQSSEGLPFNMITYNIRYNNTGDGINAWPSRKDKVAGLLQFHKADIFNVQEALAGQMDDLAAQFPDFEYVGVGRDDGKREGEHMGIFYRKSRFEKVTDGMFWLSETPTKPGFGWDAVCNRTVTWIKLHDKQSGKRFFVFNTHFDHKGVKAREEAAKLVLKSIKEINKENLPVLLTGDLNLVKTSQPVQTILQELHDSKDKSQNPPYGPEGTSGGFDVKPLNKTIDYIFINDKVSVLRYGVLSDSFGMYYPSDHLPVLAEVKIL